MIIFDETFPPSSFEQFADAHGLVLEIHERPRSIEGDGMRFYAHFKRAEVKDRGGLLSLNGNGATKQAAIEEYAKRLRGQTLVIGAYTPERREIQCPNEWQPS